MGFFSSLFRDGIKCYSCGRFDTEWVGSKKDLSAFPENIREIIEDTAASDYKHIGCRYDVYYCNRCGRYVIDFPSTYDVQGTQHYFVWRGRRLK